VPVVNFLRKNSFLVIFVILIMVYTLVQSDLFLKFIYPINYEEKITNFAEKNELDPYLLATLIYVESKYNEKAVSPKGAIGLMQIMPETGAWIAENLHWRDYEQRLLFKPEVNIEFGSWYLAKLIEEFDGRLIPALASYNAGRTNVNDWMEEGWDGKFKTGQILPFKETSTYLERISHSYDFYKNLYELD